MVPPEPPEPGTDVVVVAVVGFLMAFRAGLPRLDPKRYSVLLLFWPSLVYWPSSIGKESLMLLGLGLTAYGTARMLRGDLWGLLVTAVGLTGCGLVRPHVALIAATALIIALVVRAPGRGTVGMFGRITIIGALLVGGSIASDAVESLLDIDGLNPSGLSAALDLLNSRSAQGGSFFTAARIDGLSEYPWGFVTVLFRPLLYEASSMAMLATSIEALILAGLVVASIPRLVAALKSVRDEAYIAYCIGFTIVFVYLFFAIGNFGILVRQRVMTIPLILLAAAGSRNRACNHEVRSRRGATPASPRRPRAVRRLARPLPPGHLPTPRAQRLCRRDLGRTPRGGHHRRPDGSPRGSLRRRPRIDSS